MRSELSAARAEAPATRARPTASPRVGYVLKMYPRFSETFILNEILAVERAGVPMEILSLRPPSDGRFHEALAEVRAPVTYLSRPARPGELWALLREARPDLPGMEHSLGDLLVVDAHEAAAAVEVAVAARRRGLTRLHAHFGSTATTVARLAARLAGIPYSFTAHAKDIFHEEVDVADVRRKVADADFVVTVSDYNVGHLRDVVGAPTDRVVRLYNGLDSRRYPVSDARRKRQVVAVGRLVEKKGFADLVAAARVLVDRGTPVPVVVVGTGAEEQRLRDLVAELGLEGLVTFTGALSQGGVRDVVRESGVLAAPCVVGADGNRDGLPTVLLEAMAMGTPCVSTPVTGIPEVIRDGVTGLLVPEHDPAALADAITRLLDEPETAARYATAARALIEERFDLHRNVAELTRLFADGPGAVDTCGGSADEPRAEVA